MALNVVAMMAKVAQVMVQLYVVMVVCCHEYVVVSVTMVHQIAAHA